LALRGRQILIAAIERIVQFNILEFYRGQHTYVGVDTLGLSSVATGAVLKELVPGFASGHLKPFPILPRAIYSLENAKSAFGAVGLLSGFCLMSSLRGWWAQGDSRLIRSYALALGVAIAATQLLAARGVVDLGKSIYLQPSFSAPLMFFGGLLFGYGMVLSNG